MRVWLEDLEWERKGRTGQYSTGPPGLDVLCCGCCRVNREVCTKGTLEDVAWEKLYALAASTKSNASVAMPVHCVAHHIRISALGATQPDANK